jgi:hypothetical protein
MTMDSYDNAARVHACALPHDPMTIKLSLSQAYGIALRRSAI